MSWGGLERFLGRSWGGLGCFFCPIGPNDSQKTDIDSALFLGCRKNASFVKNVQKPLVFLWFLYIFDHAANAQNRKMQSPWQTNLESRPFLGEPRRLTIQECSSPGGKLRVATFFWSRGDEGRRQTPGYPPPGGGGKGDAKWILSKSEGRWGLVKCFNVSLFQLTVKQLKQMKQLKH